MKSKLRKSDCPINFALEIFGDKWTLLIVRDLMFKEKTYYGDFLEAEEKIATNILADRLALLENSGTVSKTQDPEHKSKKIYRLTRKGIDLLPALVEIILWSAKYDAQTAADKEFLKRAKQDKSALIKSVSGKLAARK